VVEKLNEMRDYQMALQRALEADSRNTARAASMRRQQKRSGYVHYPIDFGV
jgi:hypothetical protein